MPKKATEVAKEVVKGIVIAADKLARLISSQFKPQAKVWVEVEDILQVPAGEFNITNELTKADNRPYQLVHVPVAGRDEPLKFFTRGKDIITGDDDVRIVEYKAVGNWPELPPFKVKKGDIRHFALKA